MAGRIQDGITDKMRIVKKTKSILRLQLDFFSNQGCLNIPNNKLSSDEKVSPSPEYPVSNNQEYPLNIHICI